MDYTINSEVSYVAFVLGYDLLQDRLKESNACDESYDICVSLANLFLDSEEYENTKYPTYIMLECWIDNNKELVDSYFRGRENE